MVVTWVDIGQERTDSNTSGDLWAESALDTENVALSVRCRWIHIQSREESFSLGSHRLKHDCSVLPNMLGFLKETYSFLGSKNVDNILMSRWSNFPVLLFAVILIHVHMVPDHFEMISVRDQNCLVWRLLFCRWEVLIRRVNWLPGPHAWWQSQEGKFKSPDQADLQPFSFSGVCNFILNIHRVPPEPSFKNKF